MATVKELFQILSSFWKDHTDTGTHKFIEGLWDGYSKIINDLYRRLYQLDQAKSIKTLTPTLERDWFHLDLSYLNATDTAFTYTIDEEIVSIPKLQDAVGVECVGNTFTDITDYVVDSQAHTITFLSATAQAFVSRDIPLVDSSGFQTPAGQWVDAGGLSALVEGLDYTWGDAGHTFVSLHTKAAFEACAEVEYGVSQGLLESLVLWAPTLKTDERLVYRNFGFLLDVSPEDVPVDVYLYARIIEGLWYIAWNGPTPHNLEIGISVLFGYPVAPKDGVVHHIEALSSSSIVTINDGVELHDVSVGSPFNVIVTQGQTVMENQPLSDAVSILDEVSSPGWWKALSLARYAHGAQVPQGLSAEEELDLKSLLQNSVVGIQLRDAHTYAGDQIEERAQILKTTARFLNRLKPYYTQFAFLDSVEWSETLPDTATGKDVGLAISVRKLLHETIADNEVNHLYSAEHAVLPFADYDAYAAQPLSEDPLAQRVGILHYFEPDASWSRILSGAPSVQYIVLNIDTGPGTAFSSLYGAAVEQAKVAGVRVLGYVFTSWAGRVSEEVEADIDKWYDWYEVDGIFFDEASTVAGSVAYYQSLDTYVKAKDGVGVTVLNHGQEPDEAYTGAGDILGTFEDNYTAYLLYTPSAWVSTYPAGKFWHMVSDVDAADVANAVSTSKGLNAGLITLSSLLHPDPWVQVQDNPQWQAYLSEVNDLPRADGRAFYPGAGIAVPKDVLTLAVKYSGSGGVFVPTEDAVFEAYNAAALVDRNPPDIYLTPDPGEYFTEMAVRARPNEPCRILYTLDGPDPEFAPLQVGIEVRERIQIPEGEHILKVRARDMAGNVSVVLQGTYQVTKGSPVIRVSPSATLRRKESVAAILSHPDPTMRVYYTTDGSAPSDFVFQDILRLGGHRIVWDSETSIRLEDYRRPVFFTAGTASLNVDGPRNYEIAPRRNARYFVYAVRLGGNRWRPFFSSENIRFEGNTPTRLLLGFIVSNQHGVFTPESIVNAVDAGDMHELITDNPVLDEDLNITNPISLLNDRQYRFLRFFGKAANGLFDPPQTHLYEFDTVAPFSVLRYSYTNSPYSRTLRIELFSEDGASIYWSDKTTSPQKIIFGLADRLVDGSNSLRVVMGASANRVIPNFTSFNITFQKKASTGEMVTINTTEDVRSGAPLRVPSDTPGAFYDIVVVPDFDHAGKWRLDLGPANVALQESSHAYLVSRVYVSDIQLPSDPGGVLSAAQYKGYILNATDQGNLSNLARKTQKYVEPLTFSAVTRPYRIVLSYFAEDTAGNVEEVQTRVFEED